MGLHMAVFLLFSSLSVLRSVCITKIELLSAIFEDGSYSSLALSGFWLVGKLTAIYILSRKHEKIVRMLGSMDRYENTYSILRARLGPRKKLEYVIYFAIGSTFGIVVLEICSIYNLGLEKALLMGSHTLAKCLFLWTDGNLSEKAFLLKLEYGSQLTVTTAVMGGIVIASEIISILHTGLVLGLMTLVAVGMHTYFAELIKDIREFRGESRAEKVEEWRRRPAKHVAFWRKLSRLHGVFKSVNEAFDELFKILFAVALIFIGVFLSIAVFGTPTTYYTIFLLFVEIWFIYAGKIAEQNEELCEWIRNCGVSIGRVRVARIAVNPRLILEELEKKPIGLGPGRHIIRYTPHYLALKIFNRVWVAIFGEGNGN